ncbi:hypothetical protein [Kitasatospora griseola]|uniref:hypothetical protein n=1 Tax=Kitasatospora griseola TaxID=2064 RepID=UPI0006989DC6|nr:hypothetical protein [Kitasatospora griseola]
MLDDWTISYGPLTLGNAEIMPAVNFTSFDPLTMPDIRSNDVELIQRDGLWAGDDYMGGRTIDLSLEVQGIDREEFNSAVNLVMRAFSPGVAGESKLSFKIPGLCNGREAYVMARTRKRSNPLDANFARLYCAFEIQLFATDPVVYAADVTTVTLAKNVPALVPFDGSLPTTPAVTFTGTTSPKILDAETGAVAGPTYDPGNRYLKLTDSGTNNAATAVLTYTDTWV